MEVTHTFWFGNVTLLTAMGWILCPTCSLTPYSCWPSVGAAAQHGAFMGCYISWNAEPGTLWIQDGKDLKSLQRNCGVTFRCFTSWREKNYPLCGRELLLEELILFKRLPFFCQEAFLPKISGSHVHALGCFTQVYAAKIHSFPQKALLYFLQLLICLVQTQSGYCCSHCNSV